MALQEIQKPIMFINKIDILMTDYQENGQEIYQTLYQIVEQANLIIKNYAFEGIEDFSIDPKLGNIAFGSAKEGWAFTIPQFAKIYAKKFNTDPEKFASKLWGNNYFDPKQKKWQKHEINEDGTQIMPSFIQFIIKPIMMLRKCILEQNIQQMEKMLISLNISSEQFDKQLNPKQLLKQIMQKWICASEAIAEMFIHHIPSPKIAQGYRYRQIYQGQLDDQCASSIQNCGPTGPLMIFISKIVPAFGHKQLIAFGRIFSGQIKVGQKVKILGQKYVPGNKYDSFEYIIEQIVIRNGIYTEYIQEAQCGNLIGLIGVDQFLSSTGTITTSEIAYPIIGQRFLPPSVIKVEISPQNYTDLPKLEIGLKKLSKTDYSVQFTIEDTGTHLLSSYGESHLNFISNELEKFCPSIQIQKSDPIIVYKETVCKSSQECMAISPNSFNKIQAYGMPLSEEISQALEQNKIEAQNMIKATKQMQNQLRWDIKKEECWLWRFGPYNAGPNLLVNATKNNSYLEEIQDSSFESWHWFTKEGALCYESMRGFRVNLIDCSLHSDAIHRGSGQIIPTCRKLYKQCQLTADPTLQEPIFLTDIFINNNKKSIQDVFYCIDSRQGSVIDQNYLGSKSIIKAYIPAEQGNILNQNNNYEVFKFNEQLTQITEGLVIQQSTFDHWKTIEPSLSDKDSQLYKIVQQIRKRKGLKDDINNLVQNYGNQ